MKYYQCKTFWVLAAIFSSVLLMAGYYEFKIMTSTYNYDFGNGLIIYADDYVKTGNWVFNCKNARLISRKPLPAPVSEIEKPGKLKIKESMYAMTDIEKAQAKMAIKALTGVEGWYKKLSYLDSGLNEASNLRYHYFDLVHTHDERQWAVTVRQLIDGSNRSTFEITTKPYDPETYTGYDKELEAAAKSCPAPQ